MPSCIIQNCISQTGHQEKNSQILLHCFPKDIAKIKAWIMQTGQNFSDVDQLAMKIKTENKNNKFRMCSLHFSTDAYNCESYGRFLKPEALPTIFPEILPGEVHIQESLKKIRAKKRKRWVCSEVSANTTESDLCEANIHPRDSNQKEYRDVSVQTDLTLENCIITLKEDLQPAEDHQRDQFIHTTKPVFDQENITSTPISHSYPSDIHSPFKKRANIEVREEEESIAEDFMGGIEPLLPILEEPQNLSSFEDSSVGSPKETMDPDFNPLDISMTDSDVSGLASLIYPNYIPNAPPMENLTSQQLVQDKKLIVFESCLDNLLYKVKCLKEPTCNYLVKNFYKKFEGSYCLITGKCYQGHYFTICETQPKVGNYASGNLLLASALLFSGSNFAKIKEFLDTFGVVSICEKTYNRYQSALLFPAIDVAWRSHQEENFQRLQDTPLCVSGDGQCDSPGHSAKYCIYTLMDSVTDLILDFEIVQKSQVSSSVAMEKHGFGITMDRVLDRGMNIQVFASDRHVSIRKKISTDYPAINHQFDIWHYAKSINKKLRKASRQKLCKQLIPWIDKITQHFWWCVTTSQGNAELLKEKWLSLLYHVIDQHEWVGGCYTKCSHEDLTPVSEDDAIFWLNKETLPYKNLVKIVPHKQLLSDLQHLTHNCHTGALETFHSMALKYRTKRIHFFMDCMEARTKLAVLTHNNNVGRQQATVKVARSNTEPEGTQRTKLTVAKGNKRWIIRDVYEPLSVKYQAAIMETVLEISLGNQVSSWVSRTPSLPPNVANLERPSKAEIKRKKLQRFRYNAPPV